MPEEQAAQRPREAFIQKNAHVAKRRRNSIGRVVQQCGPRDFESRDGLLTSNRRKVIEKLVQRVPAFEVIDQCLRRHTRADEHWGAAENLRVAVNDVAALGHAAFAVKTDLNVRSKPVAR